MPTQARVFLLRGDAPTADPTIVAAVREVVEDLDLEFIASDESPESQSPAMRVPPILLADVVVVDLTSLAQNSFFEVGFSIGSDKLTVLVADPDITSTDDLVSISSTLPVYYKSGSDDLTDFKKKLRWSITTLLQSRFPELLAG
jgi:hypothetical protein